MQGLFLNTPYTHSYQTLTKSQVLTLRLDDWLFLLKHFPDSREAINKHMKHDGSGASSSSGSSHDSWPYYSPKPPKPRVTELMDKGSQPTPPGSTVFGRTPTAVFIPPAGPSRDSMHENEQQNVKNTDLWPKDSRHDDNSNASSEQISIRLDDEKSQKLPASQTTVTSEQRDTPDESFMKKVTKTAKKLMGKQTDDTLYVPSLTESSQSQRDVLLEQEDEMATTALIKEYDAKKKTNEKEYIELIEKDILLHTLDQVKSKESTTPEKEDEKEIISLDITESKSAASGLDKLDANMNKEVESVDIDLNSDVLDKKMQTINDVIDTKHSDDSQEQKEKLMAFTTDSQDQATSTAKLNRRFVRVRYEEYEDDNKKRPVSTDLRDIKPVKELTVTERNILTLDSDLHVNQTPEPEMKESTSSSTQDSSATSLKKKYSRPSE